MNSLHNLDISPLMINDLQIPRTAFGSTFLTYISSSISIAGLTVCLINWDDVPFHITSDNVTNFTQNKEVGSHPYNLLT